MCRPPDSNKCCMCAQTPVMTGRSIDNSALPCDDLGRALQDDLTNSIDWEWLGVCFPRDIVPSDPHYVRCCVSSRHVQRLC